MIKGLQKQLPVEYHGEYEQTCLDMQSLYPDMSDPKKAQIQLNNFLLFQITILRKELKDAYQIIGKLTGK